MTLTKLRKDFHKLIDSVTDREMLQLYFDALNFSESPIEAPGNTLSSSEKKEVMESYKQSLDERKLVSNDAVKKRYNKWLTK